MVRGGATAEEDPSEVSESGYSGGVVTDISKAEFTAEDRTSTGVKNRTTIFYTVRVFAEIRECSTGTALDNTKNPSNGILINKANQW